MPRAKDVSRQKRHEERRLKRVEPQELKVRGRELSYSGTVIVPRDGDVRYIFN